MLTAMRLLLLGVPADVIFSAGFEASPFGPFAISATAGEPVAPATPAGASPDFDAVLLDAERHANASAVVDRMAPLSAVLVVSVDPSPEATIAWLQRGAQDVLSAHDLASPELARRVRAAIERQRLGRASRRAYATDLATGLPHRQQFVEHMSQLLALREREPVPMAVLLLRIEGFTTTETRLGAPAADALRRKVAVRLRGAVRASDVVAAIDDVSFAVLLGSLLTATDGERVGAKLAQLLMEPFTVGGTTAAVAVAVGIGQYPQDGVQPDVLLRKATEMALDAPAQGRPGMANFEETGGRPSSAANDE
jgi:diguanylate cyclase (GGDEF)-like protein